MKTRRYSLCKKVLLLLLSLCAAVVLCEILLRAFGYYYSPLRVEVHGPQSDWRFKHSFGEDCFVYDPKLIWRPRKNYSVFNSQGFRGEELPEVKKANEFRIFALGDSNTLGWADGGANWPKYLGELLTASDKEFRVVNAGVWGYSSFQGVRRLKETLPFRPDMVLVSFGANDAHRVLLPDTEFTSVVFRSPLFKTKTGQLVVAAWHRLTGAMGNGEDLVPRVGLQEYKDNLIEMIRISKQSGIQCVLLTRPFTGDSTNDLWWKNFAPDYVAATVEVAKNHHVPVIDVYSRFEGRDEYFADESHFTKEGHRHAAKLIYEAIKRLLP